MRLELPDVATHEFPANQEDMQHTVRRFDLLKQQRDWSASALRFQDSFQLFDLGGEVISGGLMGRWWDLARRFLSSFFSSSLED